MARRHKEACTGCDQPIKGDVYADAQTGLSAAEAPFCGPCLGLPERRPFKKGDHVRINGHGRLPGLVGTEGVVTSVVDSRSNGVQRVSCRALGASPFMFLEIADGLDKIAAVKKRR